MWVLGLDPKLSGLWVSTFTHQAVFAGFLTEPGAHQVLRLASKPQDPSCSVPPVLGL